MPLVAAHQGNLETYYNSLQELGGALRLFWDDTLKAWIVTGYKECVELLESPKLARSRMALPRISPPEVVEFAERVLDAQMMFSDESSVTDRRRAWGQVLNDLRGGDLELTLAELAAASLDGVTVGAEVDVYGKILQPYASRAVCVRLGIEEGERLQIYPMIMDYVRFLDGKLKSRADLLRALLAIVTLYARLAGKRETLGDANVDRHQWISDYLLALVAGHESTAYLLATIFLNAGGERGALAVAGVDRRALGKLVGEALRFDSPVQLIGRRVSEDLNINEQVFRAGDRVFLHLGAANRDPRVFEEPTVFNPSRTGAAPLSFGWGPSQCIGRSLAVREALALLSTLAAQRLWFEIRHDQVSWENGLAGRGFQSLPARLRSVP